MVRKTYLLVLFLVISAAAAISQPRYRMFDFFDQKLKYWSIGVAGGISAYNGDLSPSGNFIEKAKTFDKSFGNFGIFGRRRFNDYLAAGVQLNYYRIGASDASMSQTNGNIKRNLSFRSNNIEVLGTVNFEFFNYNTLKELNRSDFPLAAYLISGIGLTTNNPKAELNGTWYNLRDYQTEGVSYGSTSLIIPLGLGLEFQAIKGINVLVEASYRFSNSDYLDDVSSNYSLEALNSSDPIRAALADRSFEYLNFDRSSNKKRGNPTKNDGYFILQTKFEYVIGSGGLRKIGKGIKFKKKSKAIQKITN